MPRRLALSLLFVAAAAPVTAEIYRWTDANGSIHFSDTPPRQLRHSSVSVKPPVTVPMGENIRQADRVRQSRAEVSRLLAPGSTDARERCRGAAIVLSTLSALSVAASSDSRGALSCAAPASCWSFRGAA